jgi:hypothetical protein
MLLVSDVVSRRIDDLLEKVLEKLNEWGIKPVPTNTAL